MKKLVNSGSYTYNSLTDCELQVRFKEPGNDREYIKSTIIPNGLGARETASILIKLADSILNDENLK